MAEVQKLGRDVNLNAAIERYDVIEDGGGSQSNSALAGLKSRISLIQSGQHVQWTLRVVHDGKEWSLKKRFNEVAALHDVLARRLPMMPTLPPKSAVRQFSVEYLDKRKAELNGYFSDLCSRRDILNCTEAQMFFGLPDHAPEFRQATASEPVQAAEVHEAAFGISDFAYDPMQGLLLMGATDCSWTSRMDTKITNIKLPWEPAAPNLPTSQMSLWRQSPADLRFEMQFTCRYTATISCVVLSTLREKGLCLCGLSDGTVGTHAIKGEQGVSSTGATLPLLRHTAAVAALAVDDAESWVISASKDNALIVYDTRRQMIQCEVQTPSPTTAMQYCQVQKRLFTGVQTGRVVVWNTSILPIQQVCVIPDGAGAADTNPTQKISSLDYDAVTSTLFTASKEALTVWAVKSSDNGSAWGRKAGAISNMNTAPTAIAWANSSREILAGFSTGAVIVFDLDKGEASYALQAHKDEVTTLVWLDAPRRLLTASKDKTLKIWDFPSLRRVPLEDSALASMISPTVSTAPHMAPAGSTNSAAAGFARQRGSSGAERSSFSGQRGGDPLSQSSGGGGGGYPTGSVGAADPLARSQNSTPPTSSYTGRSSGTGLPGPLGGDSYRGSAAPAASAASAPAPAANIAGAKKSAALANDSDDDLAGWDS